MRNFIQYELWKDCSNGCKFCYNRGQQDVNKIESLNFIINKLDDEELNNYDEIGFIGGEFFDTQLDNDDVKALFYKLFDKCINKIKNGSIKKLYITTALMFDLNKHLIPFLNYLQNNDILEHILLCTSFDLKYRFYTDKRKRMWEDNMLSLNHLYPNLKLHTEIIVSEFFIDAVLNDEFSITEFGDKFHTHIDYIEPISGFYYKDKEDCMRDMKDFYPSKDKFISFLYKTILINKEIDIDTFLSPYVRSDKVYYTYNGQRTTVSNRREKNTVINYNELDVKYEHGFSNSNEKMLDIVNELRQIMS